MGILAAQNWYRGLIRILRETSVHGSADVGAEIETLVGSLRTSQDKTAVLQSIALLQVANYKADDEILEMSKGIK